MPSRSCVWNEGVTGGFRDNVRLRLTPPFASLSALSVFPLPLKRRKKGNPGMTDILTGMTGGLTGMTTE
jgi:hypothetical protein